MKTILSASVLMLSTLFLSVSAHAEFGFENQCDINLSGDLSFQQNELTLTTEKDSTVLITQKKDVFVDGKKIALSASQQASINEYYDAIEQSIPQIIEVAKEGLVIANYAVGEALSGLLGANSKAVAMLKDKLQEIESGLEKHVYQHPDYITFDTRTLENDIGVSKQWDSQFDELMAEVMPAAMGEFLMAMGRSMLSGETTGESFEKRMETMGEEIEQKVMARTENIEKVAHKLCESLKSVDAAEDQVAKIPALKDLNIVKINSRA